MKKYAMLALAAMIMFSMALAAQDQAPSHERKGETRDFNKGEKHMITPEERAEKLAKALDLTDSQKAGAVSYFEKQDALHHQQREEIEKIRKEMKTKYEAQRKSNDEQLAKAIGNEKFHKFELIRAERIGEMKGRMKGRMNDRMNDKREMHQHNSPDSKTENL